MIRSTAWAAGLYAALDDRLGEELEYEPNGERAAYIQGYHAGKMSKPLYAFGKIYPGIEIPDNPYLK